MTGPHRAGGGTPMRLFVYGTLLPGQPRWPVLRPYALGWRRATALGRVWDTGSGYPAARFDGDGEPVPGVVVSVRSESGPEVLALLDRIEGEGVLFRRVEIATSQGRAVAYEWIGPTDGLAPAPLGWPPRAWPGA